MTRILLLLCGVFYAVLCVFSIVTGLMYASGKKELNPLELSEKFMERLSDPEKRKKFAVKMGWVTFAVGIVQGITAYVTSLLAEKEINILDISQTLMQGYFAMIMLVDLADCPLPFDELADLLRDKGAERLLDIHIQRQDIFEAMHRI